MAANKEHERDPKLIDISNPENRFEKSDVDYVAINKFGIGLVILCIFSFLLLTGVFKYFINKENAAQVAHRNLHPDLPKLPPEPRLQSTPVKDLAAIRAEEDAVLNGYAWVDKEKGVVRIPVDRAIDLLAQRGLPARQSTGAQSASTATVPTESGMGTILQQPGGPLAGELSHTLPTAEAAREKKPAVSTGKTAAEKPAAEKK